MFTMKQQQQKWAVYGCYETFNFAQPNVKKKTVVGPAGGSDQYVFTL